MVSTRRKGLLAVLALAAALVVGLFASAQSAHAEGEDSSGIDATITVEKELEGRSVKAGEFIFQLFDSADTNWVGEARVDANGEAKFTVNIANAGTTSYFVRELTYSEGNFTVDPDIEYDTEHKKVDVVVKAVPDPDAPADSGTQLNPVVPVYQHPAQGETVTYSHGETIQAPATWKTTGDGDVIFCGVRYKDSGTSDVGDLKRYNAEEKANHWIGGNITPANAEKYPTWADYIAYFYHKDYAQMDYMNSNQANQDEVLTGEALTNAVKRIMYNGFPYNAANMKGDMSDNDFYYATQQALWYVAKFGVNNMTYSTNDHYPRSELGRALVDFALGKNIFNGNTSTMKEFPAGTELYAYWPSNQSAQPMWGIYAPSGPTKLEVSNEPTVTFNNKYTGPEVEEYGKLSISKTIEGDGADANQEFTFTVTLPDGEFNYTGSKEGKISNGGTIALKGGESVTIDKIPAGKKYSVSEASVDNWENTSKSGDSGKIILDQTAEASFTNKYTKDDSDTTTPKISNTTAKVNNTATSVELESGTEGTFTDEITFANLEDGKEYTVVSTLQKDGANFDTKENTVTGPATSLTVTFDKKVTEAGEYKVKTELKDGDTVVATHNGNYNVSSETVTVTVTDDGKPAIKTSAKGTSGNTIGTAEGQIITDTVTYSNLEADTQYQLEGLLMDKDTEELISVAYMTDPVRFTTTSSNAASGTQEVKFSLADATELAGKSIVVYERLYTVNANGEVSDEPVAKHEDINDAAQTVTVEKADTPTPPVTTGVEVTINKTDMDGEEVDGAVIVIKDSDDDEVDTWTSKKGETKTITVKSGDYTLTETTAPSGYQQVTTVISFSVAADGTVTVNTASVEPAGACEVIDGVLVLKNAIEEDTPTPEKNPSLATTVKVDGTAAEAGKFLVVDGKEYQAIKLVDTIDYTDLDGGKEYTVTGKVMKFPGGTEVKAATETKTADASGSGTWEIDFGVVPIDPDSYYVVFESAVDSSGNGASHEDPTDVKQAVLVTEIDEDWPIIIDNPGVVNNPVPVTGLTMATTVSINDKAASSTQARTVSYSDVSKVKNVKDTIAYSGFGAGESYTIEGELIDVATGKAIATAKQTVEADSTGAGEWTMDFTGVTLEAGKKYVVFEYAYDTGNNLVAQHADANDLAQTIVVTAKPTTSPTTGKTTAKTADGMGGVTLAMLVLAVVAAGTVVVARRKDTE